MIDQTKIDEAVRRYNDGATLTEALQVLGMSQAPGRKLLVKNGAKIRSAGRPGSTPRKPSSPAGIFAMYKSGLKLEQIAKLLDTSRQNISKLLQRNGYDLKQVKQPIIPTARQLEIAQAYDRGLTPKAITTKYGVSKGAIVYAKQRAGVATKPAGFWSRSEIYHDRNETVVRRYLANDKVQDIADDLGIKMPSVYIILRRMGVAASRQPTSGNRKTRTRSKIED